MKVRIDVTVNLDAEQIKCLTQAAKTTGHGYNSEKSPRKLIQRLLVGQVTDAVTYCHERWPVDETCERCGRDPCVCAEYAEEVASGQHDGAM